MSERYKVIDELERTTHEIVVQALEQARREAVRAIATRFNEIRRELDKIKEGEGYGTKKG